MKEQTILGMKSKIETLGKAVAGLMKENRLLKDLAVGTLETIKLMDGYKEAIEKLATQMAEQAKELKKQDKKLEI